MFNEVSVYARLESPLYGALAHVLHVTAPAMGADLAAARVLGAQVGGAGRCCVVGLGIPPSQLAVLDSWPMQHAGLFDLMQPHKDALSRQAMRPRELVDELAFARSGMFETLRAFLQVGDCCAMGVPLEDGDWALLAYVRSAFRPPFVDRELDALQKLQPAMSRMLARGLRGDAAARGDSPRPGATCGGADAGQLLGRLSATERQVLSHLRSNLTERQIAMRLHRSPHTVHVHVKNIYRKMSISSRRELFSLFPPEI